MQRRNKICMQKKRDNMTDEEWNANKEKDRLRKARDKHLRKDKKKTTKSSNAQAVRRKTPEHERNKLYKRRIRGKMTEAETEYQNVENLLKMRQSRQDRNGKEHLLSNLKAKQGMRDLKELGRVEGIEFMMRNKREKDEEVIWWNYWTSGKQFKEVLKSRRPETASIMIEKEEKLKMKEDERKRLDEELDARGRWVLASDGEYYWSIPDDTGHRRSLTQYEAELEANEPILSPEEEEAMVMKEEEKRKKDREMWRKHDEQMQKWTEQEKQKKKAEAAKKQKERRKKEKEELLKPIDMPEQAEKGEYEKARDKTIQERYIAMRDSGLFSAKELKRMHDLII